MLEFDLREGLFVVCGADRIDEVRESLGASLLQEFPQGCTVFCRVGDEPPPWLTAARLMDRFFLVLGNEQGRENLTSGFFDALASQYYALVEPERNRENIEALLDLLDVTSASGTVIDFGCGPGLALASCERRGLVAVGIETAPEMRREARMAGMDVLAPEEISSLRDREVVGAIASYVLHLDPRPKELPELLDLLRGRGPMVANFHKGRGLVEFTHYATAVGGRVEVLSAPPTLLRHGPYRAIFAD